MTKPELLQKIQQAAQEKVTELDLSGEGLTELPPELGQLTQLQRLILSNNQLTQLPPELGQLTQLQELFLYNNQLTQLPPELGQLTQLRELYLYGNQLTQLPPELGQLTQLLGLYLRGNQLTELPPELGQLTQLLGLDLRHNQLTELPPVFDSVAKTIEANINRLSEEDKEKYWLGLHLQNNPFRVPIPPEILEKVGQPTDIIYYFKALQMGSRPLHEAKMLLVGQGGVGKTSLVKRLLYNTYNDHETKTEGIAIDKWSVPTPANDRIHLHIWDFGGQEIMHATHQFFLTERSLYPVGVRCPPRRTRKSRGILAETDSKFWWRVTHSGGYQQD